MAQAKYLWSLLALGVFYWIIESRVGVPSDTSPAPLSFPLLNVPLPTLAVLATAPAVLFFLQLVIFGTLRAAKTADDGLKPEGADETTDQHPNALDWAVYTTGKSNKRLTQLASFTYPLYMSVFTLEATYFLLLLTLTPVHVAGRWPLVGIATVEGIAVYAFLYRFWAGRFRRIFPKMSSSDDR